MAIHNFKELVEAVIAGKEITKWISYVELKAFTPEEKALAVQMFEEASKNKEHPQHSHTLFLLGTWYLVIEQNIFKATEPLEQSKKMGNSDAMTALGTLHLFLGNQNLARDLFNSAIALNNTYAMVQKARFISSNPDERDVLLDAAILEGNTTAMSDKAKLCFQESRYSEAMDYFDCAIKQGDLSAEHQKAEILSILSYSPDVAKDNAHYKKEAINSINRMVRSGHPSAIELKARFLLLGQMAQFANKINDFQSRGKTEAIDAMEKLRESLLQETRIFCETNEKPLAERFEEYKQRADKIIEEAHKVADKHRGWSEFLINLALTITVVGILIKGIINITNNRSFFFVHDTDSSKKLKEFSEKVHTMDIHGDLTL